MERHVPGLYGGMVCRTRYIDDALRAALPCDVIILGAGLDSRPYRMGELANARVVEVDQPAVIVAKQKMTRRLGGHVEYVPIDFDTERLDDRVDVRSKTFFIWEGVTQYVTRAAVDAVLRWVARAPRGSEIVFTYVPAEVIEGRSTRFGVEAAKSASKRAPWITGFEPAHLGEELRQFGLELLEDVGAAEHRVRYLEPIGRSLSVFEIERVARARVP
jgi:methyltransferase (TIGR00027 family)